MEDTKTRILKSALQTFSTKGYTGATTREIAAVSGVTEVTLFRHFPSKERLLEEVVCHHLIGPDFAEFVAEAKKLEYRPALESIAQFFYAGLKQNGDLLRILYMEWQRHYELMEKVYSTLIKNLTIILVDYFSELQENNIIRRSNPAIIANMFLGIWMGFFENEYLFPVPVDEVNFQEIISECIEIFVRGTQK